MTENFALDSQITFLTTTDLKKTAHFYEQLLGLSLILDQGACMIFRVTESAYVGFCQKSEMPSTQGVIITLITQDVDQYCDLLVSRGVNFEKAPALNADFNIYHCFLRDPNGYLIEIQRFEDPT